MKIATDVREIIARADALREALSEDVIESQVREEAYYHDTVYRFCRLLEEAYKGTPENNHEWTKLLNAIEAVLPHDIYVEVFGSYGFDEKKGEISS